MQTIEQLLQAKAIQIGKLSVQAATAAGSGHPATSLSLAHITTVLMYQVMRWDPLNPGHAGPDRLVLSENLGSPIVYAACADLGVLFYPDGFPNSSVRRMTSRDLMSHCHFESHRHSFNQANYGIPFFDAASGSLGQGLSVAVSLGAAARMDGMDRHIFCIIGESESRKGYIWEAMNFIAEQHLTNVIPIFVCSDTKPAEGTSANHKRDELHKKADAFGFKSVRCDGHNPECMLRVLNVYMKVRAGWQTQDHHGQDIKPLAIIADTVKGWGSRTVHGLSRQGAAVSADLLPRIMQELDETAKNLGVDKITDYSSLNIMAPTPAETPTAVPEMSAL